MRQNIQNVSMSPDVPLKLKLKFLDPDPDLERHRDFWNLRWVKSHFNNKLVVSY